MIDNNNSQLKKLPFASNKKQLVEMYINQLPENEIIYEVNIIFLKHNRNLRKKTIPHNIFTEFVKKYGLPKGYE